MTDLPQGWEWTTLGDIAEVQGGIQKQPKRAPTRNKFPFLRVANVLRGELDLTDVHEIELFNGELDRYRLVSGDLLVVEGNGSISQIGRSARWRGEIESCVHQNHLIRVRPAGGVDSTFLDYLWNSDDIGGKLREVAGSTSGLHTLSVAKLKRIRLPLPPFAEQCRIVEQLDSLLASLEAGAHTLRSALLRVSEYERRLLSETSHRGVSRRPVGSTLTSPAPADVQDGELPRLPDSWGWLRLHEVAEVVAGVTKDTAKQSNPSVPLVPYLRVANVQRGYLDLDDVAEIRVSEEKIKKLELRPGDVLLNEGGDRDKLGRGWVWEGQIERCIHQNHVFRARIRDDIIHPKLLAWHANSFGRWFEVNGKQSVNLASISLSTIRRLPVPVPPRREQDEIVAYVEEQLIEIRRLRAALEAGLAHSAVLRRSILADAFAGRLIPQDPNDEPASVLRERIRAERTAQPKQVRRRRVTEES